MNRKRWKLIEKHQDLLLGTGKDIFLAAAAAGIGFIGKVVFNLHEYNSMRVIKAPTTLDNEMIVEQIDLAAQVRDKMRPNNELKEQSWVQQDAIEAREERKKKGGKK